MSNPFAKFPVIIRFLTHDIWSYTNEDVRGIYRWLMNSFKAVFLSVRFFTAHRIMERASALTYYTLLAIVPIFALVLSIGRMVGVQEMIRQSLEQNAQGHGEAIRYIFMFADSYLNQARNGVVMGVGAVLLLYVIYSLMGNVESVLNEIWQQKRGRTLLRKVTDYLSIMILLPLGLIISSGVQIFLQTYISTDIYDKNLSAALLSLLRWTPYVLTIIMFTLIYIIIPNCKVRFRNAFTAAIISGLLFILFQQFYISGQIWVSKYNAIYGSFAALPLLLLWVQTSWIICLYGAELSYASQNIQNYNFENLEQDLSRHDRDFLLLLVASMVYNRFSQQKAAPTTEEISEVLQLPARVTGQLVQQLVEQHIIFIAPSSDAHQSNILKPDCETDKMSVAQLLHIISTTGDNRLKIDYSRSFSHEWRTFTDMHQAALDKGTDLLLRDICIDGFKPKHKATV